MSRRLINRRILNIPGASRMYRMMATGDARYLVGVSGSEIVVTSLDGSAFSTSVPYGSCGQSGHRLRPGIRARWTSADPRGMGRRRASYCVESLRSEVVQFYGSHIPNFVTVPSHTRTE